MLAQMQQAARGRKPITKMPDYKRLLCLKIPPSISAKPSIRNALEIWKTEPRKKTRWSSSSGSSRRSCAELGADETALGWGSSSGGVASSATAHRESDGATEGTGEGLVLELHDANVAGATDRASAFRAGGDLDLDGEVGGGGCGETADTSAGDVLDHLRGLEGGGVLAAGCGIDGRRQGTSTVLVDLQEFVSE